MSQNFDEKMKALLSEDDANFVADAIDETGYYKTMFGSLRGKGSGLRIASWGAITVLAAVLLVSIWQMFVATTLREQLLWATFAILTNSGQIAFKLWFNMQLNRRALSQEIRRLQLAVMAKG